MAQCPSLTVERKGQERRGVDIWGLKTRLRLKLRKRLEKDLVSKIGIDAGSKWSLLEKVPVQQLWERPSER